MSLLKNSFLLGACLLLSCNNNRKENFSSDQRANTESAPSFTILTTGIMPTLTYLCAEKNIGKMYNVRFIQAAGCIVPEKLGDSINRVNTESFEELKKFYGRDMQDEIYNRIESEYACMHKIDSILHAYPELKKYDSLMDGSQLFFDRINGQYIARFVVNEQADPKKAIWTPKVKLLVITDSASNKPVRIIEKDSTLKSLYDLIW